MERKLQKKIIFVLGIRPDIIRAALIMKYLKKYNEINVIFVWSGQHYSDNLKDIFFKELDMPKPDYDLQCFGDTDAEIASKMVKNLYDVLIKENPICVSFLGDTNTTIGCIPALMLNIPIIHIEGCWHSYDWRMPEEKFRTLTDHMADVIYTYEEEYKLRGIAEGLNPANIVVVRNPIVDILNEFYFKNETRLKLTANNEFFTSRGIKKNEYYLMTWHRRENVHIDKSFRSIIKLIESSNFPIYFPASYRTQKVIKEYNLKKIKNLIIVDPIGYEEILMLMVNSAGVISDSGTIPEECSVLNIPCVQMRKSTERPQVYDVGGCIKFDPDKIEDYPPSIIYKKLKKLKNKKWTHTLGDGKSSKRIADDIAYRIINNKIKGHLMENSHLPIQRSLIEDNIVLED
jgi:UDP-N-acetylglucosamine 2-epimerase (non-hydrolysing)